ncbi:MAG: cysteine hydrolase [Proteobacteria bacterium]|nr:cysteine hydrolase [Pseudomonadota bacterium]MDA0868777.1 cysteine hydrolase [Pseudomonadota bacterium]
MPPATASHTPIRPHIVERVMARRGRLHWFNTLDPARTALLVIDMQNTFCQPGAPAEVVQSRAIVKPINRLAAGLRQRGGAVIWVVHANGSQAGQSDWALFFNHVVSDQVRTQTMESLSPGRQQVWHELNTEPDDLTVVKNRYSALITGSSSLERILRSRGLDTVLIAGTKTNVCCESTARDAMMLDFRVVMVADCCAALSEEEHLVSLENVIQQFGDVRTSDQVLALLGA